MADPLEILEKGVDILNPLLLSNGFLYVAGESGPSSGGSYACGAYIKEGRKLEIHVPHGLGLVTYHVGTDSLRHEVFMRALLGRDGGNQYPSYSEDPIDAFLGLRHDLEEFGEDFLSGVGNTFRNCVEKTHAAQRLTPIERMEQRWPTLTEET